MVPFRYRTAVDARIAFALATTGRLVMNQPGNNLFSHSALANNQYREVGGRHLQGNIQSPVQSIAISYDVVPLFDFLKFRSIHWGDKITYFFRYNAKDGRKFLSLSFGVCCSAGFQWQFDEQQVPIGGPDEFAQPDKECYKDAGSCGQAQTFDGHEKASLAAS